jgi:SAM-dependent methyltransferase
MAKTEFDDGQFDEAYPPGIENTWWQVARCGVIERTFRDHVPRSANVLEVGCGTGIVTAHLRNAGWNVSGVEMGKPDQGLHAAEHITLGMNAVELPEEDRLRIDTLAMFDVIEHIADAPAFMRELLTVFPNTKQVVVTVPARKELWTSFDDHFGHFRRYDREILGKEFRAAGLEPRSAGYFFHGLYAAIILNNMVRGRKRNIRFVAPTPGMNTMINRSIGGLFSLEASLLPAALVGSSIIGVATRP